MDTMYVHVCTGFVMDTEGKGICSRMDSVILLLWLLIHGWCFVWCGPSKGIHGEQMESFQNGFCCTIFSINSWMVFCGSAICKGIRRAKGFVLKRNSSHYFYIVRWEVLYATAGPSIFLFFI